MFGRGWGGAGERVRQISRTFRQRHFALLCGDLIDTLRIVGQVTESVEVLLVVGAGEEVGDGEVRPDNLSVAEKTLAGVVADEAGSLSSSRVSSIRPFPQILLASPWCWWPISTPFCYKSHRYRSNPTGRNAHQCSASHVQLLSRSSSRLLPLFHSLFLSRSMLPPATVEEGSTPFSP